MDNLITMTTVGLATLLSVGLGVLLESGLMALVFWGMRGVATKNAGSDAAISVEGLRVLSTGAKGSVL